MASIASTESGITLATPRFGGERQTGLPARVLLAQTLFALGMLYVSFGAARLMASSLIGAVSAALESAGFGFPMF